MQKVEHHTLLIVDDEEDLRSIVAFDLVRKGFKIEEATNGAEAIEIVATKKIDLVITDVRMQGTDGVWLLKQIKTNHPSLPVIMAFAGFGEFDEEDAYRLGADAVLFKPCDRKQLHETIQKLLAAVTS